MTSSWVTNAVPPLESWISLRIPLAITGLVLLRPGCGAGLGRLVCNTTGAGEVVRVSVTTDCSVEDSLTSSSGTRLSAACTATMVTAIENSNICTNGVCKVTVLVTASSPKDSTETRFKMVKKATKWLSLNSCEPTIRPMLSIALEKKVAMIAKIKNVSIKLVSLR